MKSSLVAETCAGRLEGVYEKGLYAFKGVPYAAPPFGELRWVPPQPVTPWPGVRPAKAFGTVAPQPAMQFPGAPGEPEPQSEDCLYLNVFSPGLDNTRRPVMIWIHGGAFSMGSGSTQSYTTGTLAQNGNIVLVTINYRLGVLGFLNLNEVTRGRIPSTGNEGLQDQVAALRWVKENIAGFGGDPENITIFGESAGGMSVGCLLNFPEARGLFHKAMLQSPVGEMARPLDASVKITEVFLKTAGLSADDISSLRALPVEILLRAQQETAVKTEQGAAPVVPVADGIVMPRMPIESLEAGLGFKVPAVVGSNLEEDRLFSIMNQMMHKVDEVELRRTASKYVAAEDVPTLIEAYRKARAARGQRTTPFELYSAINTDLLFRKTAVRIAEAQCKYAPGGYNYLFSWKSPAAGGILGACHALEVAFVFGNHDASFGGSGPEADRLSRGMQDAWVSFARTGNPSCAALGDWPRYSEGRSSMVFDRICRVEHSVYDEELRAWDALYQLPFSNMP